MATGLCVEWPRTTATGSRPRFSACSASWRSRLKCNFGELGRVALSFDPALGMARQRRTCARHLGHLCCPIFLRRLKLRGAAVGRQGGGGNDEDEVTDDMVERVLISRFCRAIDEFVVGLGVDGRQFRLLRATKS